MAPFTAPAVLLRDTTEAVPIMAAFHLLAYYVLGFLMEDELFHNLLKGGLSFVWRESRLLTAEFCILYYPWIIYFWCVWLPDAGAELRDACLNNKSCRNYLSLQHAWIGSYPTSIDALKPYPWVDKGGKKHPVIDNADIQWREFREALPLLVGAAVALVGVVRVFNSWTSRSQVAVGSSRYVVGAQIRLVIGLLFLIVVHGVGAVFSLALAGTFVVTARTLAGTRAAIPTAWALTLLAIVAKEERLPLRRYITFSTLGGQSLRFLDRNRYQGLYEWTHSVNLMLLRLVSFAIDYHYAVLRERDGVLPQAAPEVAADTSGLGKSSGTASQPQSPLQQIPVRDRYSFAHCLSHTFYAPLFIAGPTIGFTDFLEQCHTPRQSKTHVVWYIVRLAGAMLTLEMGTHLYPCFALARSGLIGKLGPRLGAAAVFLTLNLMWLKFLVVWRVASAWALAEGIAVPENMRRALCNHFSIAGFWKCWHASFNRWLVKYLYIPVGGRDNRVLAALLTFLFVALWHDIEAKLLAWGLLNAGFVALETVAGGIWRNRGSGLAVTRPWVHRQLGALGGTTYIIILMGVNMIGYSIGIGGASALLEQSADEYMQAIWVLLGAYAILFSGVQVMIELRKLDGTTPRATPGISQSADGPTGEATGTPADDTKRD